MKGTGWAWYHKLKPASIDNFNELSRGFAEHFIGCRQAKNKPDYLKSIRQREGEELGEFLRRFNEEALKVEKLEESQVVKYLWDGLLPNDFAYVTTKQRPKTLSEFMQRAQEHIQAEEQIQIRQAEFGRLSQQEIDEQGKRKGNVEARQRAIASPPRNRGAVREPKETKNYRPPHIIQPSHRYDKYTPLNVPIYHVLMAVQDTPLMKRSAPLKFPVVG